MRVNDLNSSPAFITPKANSKPHLTGGAVVIPKLPGQALGPQTDWRAQPVYKPGDGDTAQLVRPGSMKAYSLPSRGLGDKKT